MKRPAEEAPASGPTIQRPSARAGFRFARPALAERRQLLRLERRALARRLEIPEVNLWKIERRRLRASPDRQQALAQELGASVDELFAPEPPRPEKPEKKARRLEAVRQLEERRVPRMKMRVELERLGFSISQSQLHADLRELDAGHRLYRKHPKPAPRQCERCGEWFTPDGHQAAQPRWGRFCSRPCHYAARQVAEPEERVCERKGCEVRFTPYPSEAVRPGHGRFCTMRCRGLHLFRTGQLPAFVDSLRERGLWGEKADAYWPRVWNGQDGGRPTLLERDEASVRLAAGLALECYRRKPDVSRSDVVALVVLELEGREALFRPDGRRRDSRDPVRRSAEKRAVRRLSAAGALPDVAGTLLARDF